ncbi:hypothetical protein SAMN06265365_1656 [Tistlia consotensis]|uniref:Uncharacterized protein n=1 Tax=Tistlia consotensis USBA 355 TaxID=560819 RepID=A0A1Y6CYG9_9PROT|nr:hypothetical protein [Tistlia consotensis]SMF85854.1 hypothetical protein SAMN05428998_1732 [Tistlia consotensis USBA 355]SNS39773.1 hypothetical protein SAMN06265365_1656 [Tistlia consotensis]
MAGLPIIVSEGSPKWVVDLLRVADAIAELGPIRADFFAEDGFHLDGRAGVLPQELIDAAVERRRRRASSRREGRADG